MGRLLLIDVTDGAQLKNPTTPNTAIDLVAQNIKIENGATVFANDVRLVAAKGNTSVSLSHDVYGNLLLPKFAPTMANAGKVLIEGNDTTVTSGGDGGGRVAMWGQNIALSNGGTVTSTNDSDISANNSEGIEIKGGNVSIDSDALIESITEGAGSAKGGDINIYARSSINIRGLNYASVHPLLDIYSEGYAIASLTIGGGTSGNIRLISGGGIRLSDTAIVSITGASGSSGDVTLNSGFIAVNNSSAYVANDLIRQASVSADSQNCTTCGTLGRILISANKSMTIENDSHIYAIDYFGGGENLPARAAGGSIKLISPSIVFRDGSQAGDYGDTYDILGEVSVIAANAQSFLNQSSVTAFSNTPIYFYSGGSSLFSDHSGINVTQLFGNSSENINFTSDSLILNNQSGIGLLSSTGSRSSNVTINVNGLFSVGNRLNGQYFIGESIPIPTSAYKTLAANVLSLNVDLNDLARDLVKIGNYIGSFGDRGNVVVAGALLNLSGAMSNLPPANFKSKEIANSCEVANTGSLSLTGKGRTASGALDRLIYGY